jgi:hypothetical protein
VVKEIPKGGMIVEDDKQLLKELADITCSLISFVKRNMSHDLTYINIKHLELIEEMACGLAFKISQKEE